MTAESASDGGRIEVLLARTGELVDAYPAGTHDRELRVSGDVSPAEVEVAALAVFESDPRCRRVVLPVPEGDLEAIAWAEEAGFRFVVDVDTRRGAFSLLVFEPQWVRTLPSAIESIPLQQ